jgi:hypothetical protein
MPAKVVQRRSDVSVFFTHLMTSLILRRVNSNLSGRVLHVWRKPCKRTSVAMGDAGQNVLKPRALNRAQFSIPSNTTIGRNGVGSITSTARPSRQVQLALRLMF